MEHNLRLTNLTLATPGRCQDAGVLYVREAR
jgi:hypothetical protein